MRTRAHGFYLPERASFTSSSVGLGFTLSKALAAITNPGVQKETNKREKQSRKAAFTSV
jgi:hypothetical protein